MPESMLTPYTPGPVRPWDRRLAAHLLRRAGFAPTAEEIDAAVEAGPERTVESLLADPAASGREPSAAYRDALKAGEVLRSTGDIAQARTAWVLRMMHTDFPLREKLALFWHGHFATGFAKVQDSALMIAQVDGLRDRALGKFHDLLAFATGDPAMIIWLDNNTNRKGHANENYAREIMELFSLGVGNYTEHDIREAGRAFTGWHTDRRKKFAFNASQFDDGPKTVLGVTGPLGGEDIVRVCCEQPACARFIAGKLFRFLVHESPSEPLLAELADGFRKSGLDTAWLVRTLLRSREFFSERAYRGKIRGPVELTVGSARALRARVNAHKLAEAAAEMGQALYDPPTVKGWDGGRLWVNSATVLVRMRFLQALCAGGEKLGEGLPAAVLIARHKLAEAGRAVDWLLDTLLQSDVGPGVRDKLLSYAGGATATVDEGLFRRLAQLVVSLPEYQMA